ncbi:ABC transporter ATP-binding protein [Amedibacillus dolichus]|uniref:ABC transporter ATP-binding protein n=1 Tax=Amedibacillus dolichus TaxID=31971 RepID=A0ABT7UBV3_9FIRM|nr:ABC transporter ATP-binding protein [Amedibacillus dolichus]MDM8157087.1 ABC transporter ATP-binding protein [Amedibacillus dolichus]
MNKRHMNFQVLGRLLRYVLKHYKFSCLVVLVFIILSSVANVSVSLFIRVLIDDYITPLSQSPSPDFSSLLRVLLQMLCVFGMGVFANFAYQRILVNVGQGTLRNIRDDLFAHMEKLPIGYFDTHPHGDIMSVYTNDTDTLRQVITQSLPMTIQAAFNVLFVGTSMIIISLPLALLSFFMVGVMLTVARKIGGRSARNFQLQQKNLGRENGYIEEMLEGSKVIKVFTHEQEVIDGFNKINEDLFESSYKANMFASMLMPVVANIGNVSYVLVTLVGGVLAIGGWTGLTLGGLASFLQLNRSFNMPISNISQQMNAVAMAMAGAERIFALMDETVEVDQGTVTLTRYKEDEQGNIIETQEYTNKWAWRHPRSNGSIEYVPLRGEVLFHDVTFGYVPNKTVLHDIELYAKPGQKIAFVGATGAGKTTITNLINRFYDIQKGSITYDGIDVKLIKKDDLRRSLGIVLQDTHLFSGTIRDNIRYGKPDASDEEVLAAAKLANAHDFIRHLEHGYDTYLSGDGSSLSQGQRQLLSIARAALANAPVLILDEATSSIDSRTEKMVQDGMDKLMSGRTTFVIAHRLSTIKNSDVIMVLDQGRIIERGNHESLLAKKGIYYQLYTGALEMD